MTKRFPQELVDAAANDLVIGVRVGQGSHRFTAVWSVVVDGRVFARSWSLRPDGWNALARRDPDVTVQLGGVEVRARAVPVTSEALDSSVDEAYRIKYRTPGSLKYVADLTAGEARGSTMEFVPL